MSKNSMQVDNENRSRSFQGKDLFSTLQDDYNCISIKKSTSEIDKLEGMTEEVSQMQLDKNVASGEHRRISCRKRIKSKREAYHVLPADKLCDPIDYVGAKQSVQDAADDPISPNSGEEYQPVNPYTSDEHSIIHEIEKMEHGEKETMQSDDEFIDMSRRPGRINSDEICEMEGLVHLDFMNQKESKAKVVEGKSCDSTSSTPVLDEVSIPQVEARRQSATTHDSSISQKQQNNSPIAVTSQPETIPSSSYVFAAQNAERNVVSTTRNTTVTIGSDMSSKLATVPHPITESGKRGRGIIALPPRHRRRITPLPPRSLQKESIAIDHTQVTTQRTCPSIQEDDFNYIVIDGPNVAMAHGNGKCFSAKHLQICVEFFKTYGFRVMVFVPEYWSYKPRKNKRIEDQSILNDLRQDGCLVFIPCRTKGSKMITPYDDRFILDLAVQYSGIVVSNDEFRDLMEEKVEYKKIINERLLHYTFEKNNVRPKDIKSYKPLLDFGMKRSRKPNSRVNKQVVKPPFHPSEDKRRCIIIDGYDVGINHGNGKCISGNGIRYCASFFLCQGHRVIVCVPSSFDPSEECLKQLRRDGCLVYRLIRPSYNQCLLVTTQIEDGILVSNNKFRDFMSNASWKEIIEERRLTYCFGWDMFMTPADPFGRSGPSLDEFLKKPNKTRVTDSKEQRVLRAEVKSWRM